MLHLAASWLLSYGMHSIALSALALVAICVVRMGPASRCIVWRSALFMPLVTASLAVASSTIGSGDRAAVSVTEPIRRYFPSRWGRQKVEMTVTSITGRPSQRLTRVDDPLASTTALVIVLTVGLAVLAGILAQRMRSSRIRRALSVRTVSPHRVLIAAQRRISLTESDFTEVPIALRGREICVPRRTFFAMNQGERTSVLLHEIAHVERHDPMWMDASRFLGAMTWWQPLNRMVCDRLELDTESAADERAVALGARPQALVAGLAYFAGLIDTGFAGAGAALLHRDSPLVTRARLLLDQRPSKISATGRRILVLTLLGAAATLAALPVPTTAGAAPARGGRIGAPAGSRIVEEERDVTILRNDRQP